MIYSISPGSDGPASDDPDDERLVLLAQQGNEDAFVLLFQRHNLRICRFIFHIVPNQQDMEDIAGRTWEKAWRNLRTLEDRSKFKSWLTTTARHTALDYLRAHQKDIRIQREENSSTQENENISAGETTEELAITVLAFEDAWEATLKRMRSEQTKCFILRFQGLRIEEIAKQLNLAQGTVSTYICGAKRYLREEFDKRKD